MLGHSISYYLPKYWAQTPLYSEKLIPLLDHLLSVESPYADKLALAYYDIWNKYTSPEEMTPDSIRALIRELGYGYILDLLSTSDSNLEKILFLLPLIHYLKDTKKGLEVVFSLLQSDDKPVNTKINVWHESNPVGEEDTFSVESDINLASVDADFFEKFDTFVRKYVYPTLTGLKVSYSVSGGHTLLPVVKTKIIANLNGKMDV